MLDTTRPREEGEIDAVDYYFVNKQPFEQMVADNRFAFLYSSLILLSGQNIWRTQYYSSDYFIPPEIRNRYDIVLTISTKSAILKWGNNM